jgi:negative regulator of sigma E activity
MDCRAAEIALSALSDGAIADPDEATAVREHCAGCESCSRYADALRALRGLASPSAPIDLADRIAAAVASEAAALTAAVPATAAAAGVLTTEAAPLAPDKPTAGPEAVGRTPLKAVLLADAPIPGWLNRSRLWTLTGTIALSAATIVVAIVVSQNVSMRSQMDQLALENAKLAPTSDSAPVSGAASPSAPAAPTSSATAPDYILYRGGVFVGGASVDATASSVTTEGTVLTSLGSAALPTQVITLRMATDPRAVVLRLPGGACRRFDPVTRTYGGRLFQLQSGATISRFGEWPRLIGSVPEPTAADGSPALRRYGLDSTGVPVYVRVGASPESGFAVAPGTQPSDPAAGNPFWTWWAPAP